MKKPFKTNIEQPNYLSPEQADKIFQQISDRLKLKQSCSNTHPKRYFFKQFYKKYIFKKAALGAVGCLALLLVLPGTVIPTSFSKVSAASIDDGRMAKVEFYINCLLPVQAISASINSKVLNVNTEGYQHYSVDVPENGTLLLEVASLTGIRHTEEILIDTIDDEAPSIVSHTVDEHTITIYLTDNGGSGINYSEISAYSPVHGRQIYPVDYDEAKNCVVFLLPDSQLYITIPDKIGNKKLAVLTPPN